MTKKKSALEMHLPEPRFLCEGVDFGAVKTQEVHTRMYDEGYRTADDLYYDELLERSTSTECHGFFCQGCVEAFGHKIAGRTTLKEAIRQQLEARLSRAAEETARMLHYR